MSSAAKIFIFGALAGGLIFYGSDYAVRFDKRMAEEAATQQKADAELRAQVMAKLKQDDVVVGTGTEAKPGDTVSVNYIGTLDDGKEFDNSYKRKMPFEFKLGAQQVIPGWDIGIQGMKVGGKRTLVIPPELGYGPSGSPGGEIPPNATLHFTVELLAVNGAK